MKTFTATAALPVDGQVGAGYDPAMTAGDDGSDSWEEETCAVDLNDLTAERGELGRNHAYLIILQGKAVGEMVKVGSGLSIGRSAEADLRLLDQGVSRVHATLKELDDGSVLLVDAASRNGTFVNGRQVGQAVLSDGDKIQVGTTAILKFSYADQLDETFARKMFEAAQRDALTGAFNRRYLMQQLESEVLFVQRHGTPLSLMMLDIDRFKQINDRHGHPVGDAVLSGLVKRLSAMIRGEDLLARYGGEEFVVMFRGITADSATNAAERLRAHVAEVKLVESLPELQVTFSAGVAALPDPRIADARGFIDAADQALYRAKQSGRNRVCVFSPAEGQ